MPAGQISAQPILQRDQWNSLLRPLPNAHILQSWEWGDFKQASTGWTAERFAYQDASGTTLAAASLLTRRVGPLAVAYVPKGPALDYAQAPLRDAVLGHLRGLARRRHLVWLKIDPDLPYAYGIPPQEQSDPKRPYSVVAADLRTALEAQGWRFSANQVQFRNTLLLDLSLSEGALLAGMSQSTRRKLRQADKQGVAVRPADLNQAPDLQKLYQLYQVTGQRQGFLIRPLGYYRDLWQRFAAAGLAQGFLAEVDGQAAAGAVLFHFGRKVWFFYGMTDHQYRDSQANYLLHWHIIRWAKAQGYPLYDWWGAPDHFTEADPMWGVYRFKDGFGGRVVHHMGAWDSIPHPALYWAYEQMMPRLLQALRRRHDGQKTLSTE